MKKAKKDVTFLKLKDETKITRLRLFAGIIACLVLVVGGCVKTFSQQPISNAIQGDPTTAARIKQILKENPQIVIGTKNEYSLIVVEPDPRVDYKIMRVSPDPNVDYKMIILDPRSGKELPDLSRQFGDVLREELRQQEQNETKD